MDHTILINDKKVAYSDVGEGNVILFLHGWGTSKLVYSNLIDILSAKYRCISIDLPGFGGSDIIEHITLTKISNIISKVVKKLNIKKFNLIGHSLGGAVSLVYASNNLEHVNKLVLISPFVTFKQFSRSALYIIIHIIPFLISKILSFKNPNMRIVNAFQIVYYLSRIDLYKYLRKVRRDILIIFGTRDNILSLKPLEPIFGIFNNIHLSIFQDVRHFVISYNFSDLANKIDLFFSKDQLQ